MSYFALSPWPRRAYQGFWLGAALLFNYLAVGALFLAAGGNDVSTPLRMGLAFGWAAYLVGAMAAFLWQLAAARISGSVRRLWLRLRLRESRRGPVPRGRLACLLNVTATRQSIVGRSTASALGTVGLSGLAIVLLSFGFRRFLSETESLAIMLLLAALVLILLSRMNAHRVKFLSFAGFAPLAQGLMPVVAMIVLVTPIGLSVPAVAPSYATLGVLVILALLTIFGLVAYLRSLHYRLKSRGAADLAMQVDGLCVALLGFAFAPLGVAYLIIRVFRLHRQGRAATWSLS